MIPANRSRRWLVVGVGLSIGTVGWAYTGRWNCMLVPASTLYLALLAELEDWQMRRKRKKRPTCGRPNGL